MTVELTQAPGSSSCPTMENSTDSMSDNRCDKDNPLKQVLQLCSTLAGKGCEFSISVRIKDSFAFSLKSGKSETHQGKKRSPSFYRRQERRKLLKKKNADTSLEQPLETMEAKEKDTCSLDLNPYPDNDLFGLKENSEQESDSYDSGSETGRDASGDQAAVSEEHDGMETDGHWKVVTPRGPGGRRHSDRSLSPVSMKKYRFVVSYTRFGMYKNLEVFVNAPADVAQADVASAVRQVDNVDFVLPKIRFHPHPKLKYIPELREYEYSNTKSFKH